MNTSYEFHFGNSGQFLVDSMQSGGVNSNLSQYGGTTFDLLTLGFGDALLHNQPLIINGEKIIYPNEQFVDEIYVFDAPPDYPPPFNSETNTLVNATGQVAGYGSFYIEYHPIPEPTSLLLLGSGLVGLAGVCRRKFRKNS